MQATGLVSAIVAVGVALAGMNLHLARGMNALRRDVADLRARMARIDGVCVDFVRRRRTDARNR